MLKNAALGVAVVQAEGQRRGAILAADIVVSNILSALGSFAPSFTLDRNAAFLKGNQMFSCLVFLKHKARSPLYFLKE